MESVDEAAVVSLGDLFQGPATPSISFHCRSARFPLFCPQRWIFIDVHLLCNDPNSQKMKRNVTVRKSQGEEKTRENRNLKSAGYFRIRRG